MQPNNLAVYLSNRCNLSCRYCYVAVNQGEAQYLCEGQIKDAIDLFLKGESAAERKVSFLGGEPLLRWDVLQSSIQYVRAAYGSRILLQIFTNGTELTRERLDILLAADVEVTLSLDGAKEINDLNRIFHNQDGSPFEAAMRSVDALPKERLGVNLVFTTRTLDQLLRSIDFFQNRGFGRISFTPDVNEHWPQERIEDLRRVMDGFRRYYALLNRTGAPLFAIANLYAILEKSRQKPGQYWWQNCHNLVLGGDGNFYACDKSLGFRFDKIAADRIGSAETGVDWQKREEYYAKARALIAEVSGDANAYTSCPMGTYFVQTARGQDPSPALSNFEAVSSAYGEPLLALARELWSEPRFRRRHAVTDGTPAPAAEPVPA